VSTLAALWQGGWLRPVDHALALALARARPDTPDAVQAAVALASRALAQGHARVPLAQVPWLLAELAPGIDDIELPPLPDLDDWRAVLDGSPWVHACADDGGVDPSPPDRVLVLEGNAIALRRYRELEVRLATALRARVASGPGEGARLHLLTGGPGTGKTTRVAQALVEFAQARRADGAAAPRVRLAAPTGKAAARLAEAVRDALAAQVAAGRLDADTAAALAAPAATLHRLLGWQRDGSFRHGPAHPLAADVVVVDEASMVDLPLMCALVEAVPADAVLWLVGDRDQLPAVEAGDVLAALCAASEGAFAPFAAHRVHLTRVYRQAAGLDIARLAHAVRDAEPDAALAVLADGLAGVDWRPDGDRVLAEAVRDEVVPAFRRVAEAADAAAALRAAQALRVLCAVREGPAGSRTINAVVGQALDPLHGGEGWHPGRLVLVVENSPRQGLFNGDVGVAWPDAQGEMRVWFDAVGDEASAGEPGPRAFLPAALPAHEPAYALTVHKAQGSEFDAVWLVLPERGARVLSRELLYTGLTRARRRLVLWASEPALRQAIGRGAARWSGLAARLG
jgi:exodeoxyribonuclease V alpha subunit